MLAAGTGLAAIIAIVAFAVLDTPDEPPTQDAFTREADAQCVAAKQQVAAAGAEAAADSKAGAQSRYVVATLAAVTEWKLAFESLEPTPGHAEQAQALDDALLAVIVELGALSRQSRVGSQAEISAQAAATDEATASLETAISDLGLAECPTTSLDTAPRPG